MARWDWWDWLAVGLFIVLAVSLYVVLMALAR